VSSFINRIHKLIEQDAWVFSLSQECILQILHIHHHHLIAIYLPPYHHSRAYHVIRFSFIYEFSKVVKKGNAEFSSHWHVLHITLLSTFVISFEHQYLHQVHSASVSIPPDFKAFVSPIPEESLFHPSHIPSPSIIPYLLHSCVLLILLFVIFNNG
jgi:hypothetical protein